MSSPSSLPELVTSLTTRCSPVELTSTASSDPPLTGLVRNAEALFPEWRGVDEESWEEPPDPPHQELPYPPHWGTSRLVSLRSLLGFEEADLRSRKKEPARRKDQRPEFTDAAVDVSGTPLPRVFVDSASHDFLGLIIPRPFRQWGVAGDSGELGPGVVDGALCSAFRAVECFASRSGLSGQHFLWRNIFPQNPEGRPYFNPLGKYCVRLHLAGGTELGSMKGTPWPTILRATSPVVEADKLSRIRGAHPVSR